MVHTRQSEIEGRSRYRLLRKLGQGAMGEVHLAEDLKLGRTVAVKFLVGENLTEADTARFLEEARSLGRLRHPHVMEVLDCGAEGGRPYIALEYVRGQSLRQHLRGRGIPPLAEALRWMDELCDAVAFAHGEGILHRDLKPSNVMLDGEKRVKVADFGLAKRGDRREELTRTGMILGTPSYLAPECIVGGRATEASDLYALAVMAFELVTGRLPFVAEGVVDVLRAHCEKRPPDPRSLRPDLPRPLCEAILRGLAKDPADRPSDVASFRRLIALGLSPEELEKTQTRTQVLSRPPSRASERPAHVTLRPTTGQGRGRKGMRLALLVVAVVLLVAGGSLVLRRSSDGNAPLPSPRFDCRWNGAAVAWDDGSPRAWDWSLFAEVGEEPLIRGHVPRGTRHAVTLRSLRPGRRYRFRIQAGDARLERSFATPRPELVGKVVAVGTADRFCLDWTIRPAAEATLVVEPVGSSFFSKARRDVPARGPAVLPFDPGKRVIQSYLWSLQLGQQILARGQTRAIVASHDLPGDLGEDLLAQGPVWVGRRILCASERGQLVSYHPGSPPRASVVGRAPRTTVLTRDWQLRPFPALPPGNFAPSSLLALSERRCLWICGSSGRAPGFVREVDVEARSGGEGRLFEGDEARVDRGDEWTHDWSTDRFVTQPPARREDMIYFFSRGGRGPRLHAFDLKRRRFIWELDWVPADGMMSVHADVSGAPRVIGDRLLWFFRDDVRSRPTRVYRFQLMSCPIGEVPVVEDVGILDRFQSQAYGQRLEVEGEAVWYCSEKALHRCDLSAGGGGVLRRWPISGGEAGEESSLLSGPCLRRPSGILCYRYDSVVDGDRISGIVVSRWRGALVEGGGPAGPRAIPKGFVTVEDTADKRPWLVDLRQVGKRLVGTTRAWVFAGASPTSLRGMDLSVGEIRYAATGPDGLHAVSSRRRLWLLPLALLDPSSEAEKTTEAH